MNTTKQRVIAANRIAVKIHPRFGASISGRLLNHIKNVEASLGRVTPPKKGTPGHGEYKRKIIDLIGNLHFHLSELD